MTLSELSDIGSLASGLGVIASLIFVGLQLRQNTKAVRAAASQAHVNTWHELSTAVIEHADFAQIWRLGLEDINALDANQRVRFYANASAIFRFVQGSWLQWRDGHLDDCHWEIAQSVVVLFASQPGMQSYWQMRRMNYSKAFRDWYEALPQARPVSLYGPLET